MAITYADVQVLICFFSACVWLHIGIEYKKYRARSFNIGSMKEKAAFVPEQRVGGWCEPTTAGGAFRSRDSGDEPDRRTGYRAF